MQNTNKVKLFYTLFTLAGFLIILLPVGIANFIFGYILGDSPCTLCWGQREAMIFIGVIALFIVRFGFKFKYIATLLLMAAFGLWQSFMHVGNHAHRDLDQGFGLAVFRLHTYFWAEVVFWAVIFLLGIIFFFAPKLSELEREMGDKNYRPFNAFSKTAFIISCIVVFSNVVQAFVSTGVPPYYGQGDPVRFSWNPKFINWSSSGHKNHFKTISFLGKRDIALPDYAFLPASSKLGINWDNDSNNAPLEIDNTLKIKSSKQIANDLALNTLSIYKDGFVASSKWSVFFYDKDFNQVNDFILDPYYSATVDPLVSIMVLDDDSMVLMGSNKTLAKVKENKNADESVQWASFIKGYNKFDGLSRARIDTVRAKFYHIGSAASDENNMYLATLPNNKNKKLIIQEVSLSDNTLNAEWQPKARLKDARSLGELYITSMFYDKQNLYALSKQFNLIAKIDLKTKSISQTLALPSEIKNARALIVKNDEILVLSYQDGKNILYTLE